LIYSYDTDGRVTAKSGTLSSTGMPSAVTGNTFNADNAMTGFNGTTLSYDANGNLSSDGTNAYTWDARNHLTAISGGATASFVYDAFGRRVQKTVNGTSTQFLYDGWNPVQEFQGGTPSANLLTGLGIDQYFQRTDATGPSSYLSDALGSTLALSNSAGGLTASYVYEPFGKASIAGSSSNPYQFSGRENDGTGLYFYRARYYQPILQRFISQDPIGFAGGDPNLYAYVANNPLNFIDLLGLCVPPPHVFPPYPKYPTLYPDRAWPYPWPQPALPYHPWQPGLPPNDMPDWWRNWPLSPPIPPWPFPEEPFPPTPTPGSPNPLEPPGPPAK